MKGAIIILSNDGCGVANIIKERLGYDIFASPSVEEEKYNPIPSSLTDFIGHLISKNYTAFIFVSASGIAVRAIAPHIINKLVDPAVVVVDCYEKNVISLLSGHLGGANTLARTIAEEIGGQAIITTASDQKGISSVDVIAMALDCSIDSMIRAKEITSMMVNEKKVGLLSKLPLPGELSTKGLIVIKSLEDIDDLDGVIIIGYQGSSSHGIPVVRLTPKYYSLGIGCRRGVDYKTILEAFDRFKDLHNMSKNRIIRIATIDKKANEEGIISFAKDLNLHLEIINHNKILEIEEDFSKSEFVKKTVGVSSVAEPCAHISSGGGTLIGPRFAYKGVTLAAAIINN